MFLRKYMGIAPLKTCTRVWRAHEIAISGTASTYAGRPSYLQSSLRRRWAIVTEELTIVAFGDSLTVGYQSPTLGDEWPRPSPYTSPLTEMANELLRNEGAGGLTVEFLNRGIVGQLTEDMADRFDRDVVESGPDAVVILGGSNDLGWGIKPEEVASNLAEMYEKALEHGIRPVSCTVPSILGFDEGLEPRLQLNNLIKQTSIRLGIDCVDLFVATGGSDGRLKVEFSNDGLHLNPAGYRAMAVAIFEVAIRPLLRRRLQSPPTSSSLSR